jgi:hypothetical protein
MAARRSYIARHFSYEASRFMYGPSSSSGRPACIYPAADAMAPGFQFPSAEHYLMLPATHVAPSVAPVCGTEARARAPTRPPYLGASPLPSLYLSSFIRFLISYYCSAVPLVR